MYQKRRGLFLSGFLFCFVALAIAGYFQFIEHLEPCPLCIMQRVAMLAVGVVCLFAAIHNPQSIAIKVYGILLTITAGIGATISARHVWLQNLPEDQVPSCGPGLNFMIENFPLYDALQMVLQGSGECAEVLWTFMGLSIPAWTLVAFIGLTLMGLLTVLSKRSNNYFM
jgi:disulfide bond formation protein DsbB